MTSTSYVTPPIRNQCVFSSAESSVQSSTDKTTLTQSLKETEGLRAEFSEGLSELVAKQTEFKDEIRNYAWRSEKTLKELEALLQGVRKRPGRYTKFWRNQKT